MSHGKLTPSTPPEFKSTLPEEFLAGLDARGRYLYIQADEARQMNQWLMDETCRQSKILEAVNKQTNETNGRVLKAEGDIRDIKAEQVVIKEGLSTVTFIRELVQKRWFWVVLMILAFVIIPAIATAPAQDSVIRAIWTAIFG